MSDAEKPKTERLSEEAGKPLVHVFEVTRLLLKSEDGADAYVWEREWEKGDRDSTSLGTLHTGFLTVLHPHTTDAPAHEGIMEDFPTENLEGWSFSATATYRGGGEVRVFEGTVDTDETNDIGERTLESVDTGSEVMHSE